VSTQILFEKRNKAACNFSTHRDSLAFRLPECWLQKYGW